MERLPLLSGWCRYKSDVTALRYAGKVGGARFGSTGASLISVNFRYEGGKFTSVSGLFQEPVCFSTPFRPNVARANTHVQPMKTIVLNEQAIVKRQL